MAPLTLSGLVVIEVYWTNTWPSPLFIGPDHHLGVSEHNCSVAGQLTDLSDLLYTARFLNFSEVLAQTRSYFQIHYVGKLRNRLKPTGPN